MYTEMKEFKGQGESSINITELDSDAAINDLLNPDQPSAHKYSDIKITDDHIQAPTKMEVEA